VTTEEYRKKHGYPLYCYVCQLDFGDCECDYIRDFGFM